MEQFGHVRSLQGGCNMSTWVKAKEFSTRFEAELASRPTRVR